MEDQLWISPVCRLSEETAEDIRTSTDHLWTTKLSLRDFLTSFQVRKPNELRTFLCFGSNKLSISSPPRFIPEALLLLSDAT